MKTASLLAASVACLSVCDARIVVPNPEYASFSERAAAPVAAAMELVERAYPDSPSGGYAPASVDCPAARPTIRPAGTLSPNETAWLPIRRNNTVAPMIDLLTRANISGFDARAYITRYANNASALPNIAIAASGGGYRALMNGAGFLAAADNRTINSTNPGQIGGLLQASTYLAGLSGGSWLVGSMFMNNFSSVQTLRDGSSGSNIWQFQNSIFSGPPSSGLSILNTAEYFRNIYDQVQTKNDRGYNTSITDYWGRALSYQLINATDGGPAYTWSSIAQTPNFANGQTPFPIVVSDGRSPGTLIVSLNSTVFEFNPYELGSSDPTLYAFAPVRYLGSPFNAGVVPSGQQCVRGFDQGGFVMGTSSTLFNQAFLQLNSTSSSSILTDALTAITKRIGSADDDIAEYNPNPFYQYNNQSSISRSAELDLVDGGEDGQNIPLDPLIQPERAVDVIFAIDSSADTTYNWPNGTSLVATYQRSMNPVTQNGTAFPSIPDQNTFVNLGLNTRPTFFGCDATNATNSNGGANVSPLIVYVPNAPYITPSNVSTFNLSYTINQRNLIIRNGYNVATLGNGTIDSQWSTCLACAILSRSFTKTGTTVPAACTTCFSRYCWNGTVNSTTPNGYTPNFYIANLSVASSGSVLAGVTGVASVIAGLVAVWLL